MSDNPYQSPASTDQPPQPWTLEQADIVPTPMYVSYVFQASFRRLQGQTVLILGGVFILYIMAMIAVQLGLAVLMLVFASTARASIMQVPASILQSIVRVPIDAFFLAGAQTIILKTARRHPFGMGDALDNWSVILPIVLSQIIIYLISGVIVGVSLGIGWLVSTALDNSNLLPIVTALIAVAPLIYVGLMFVQATWLIVDRRIGAVHALRTSAQIMSGNRVHWVLLSLACVPINIAGALLLLVGLVYTMPLTYLAMGIAYLTMIGDREGSAYVE